MVTVRSILLAISLIISGLALPALPEQPSRAYIVGLLFTGAGSNDPLVHAIAKGLGDLGYVKGRDFRFEFRGAQGQLDRLPRLADELVQLKVDVIVVATEAALRAAKQSSATIPIVANLTDYDPVASGLIESLAHPGGNVTGIFTRAPELIGKRIELLKEAIPNMSRVGVLYGSYGRGQLEAARSAARSLGIEVVAIELQTPYDFNESFKIAKQKKVAGAILLYSPGFWPARDSIARQAVANRLPLIAWASEFARAGFFASYGSDAGATFERLAYFIDRVLKGVAPTDLPVEQTSKLELVINLRTAKAIGLTVAPSLLTRADEVIR
jgi:ABC-type uncharacterized transport system substrate-binding protein